MIIPSFADFLRKELPDNAWFPGAYQELGPEKPFNVSF